MSKRIADERSKALHHSTQARDRDTGKRPRTEGVCTPACQIAGNILEISNLKKAAAMLHLLAAGGYNSNLC